ncbi:MAG: hypothetical protein IT427_16955 [Pirellulales bacterium]|nr:hypothetical protein [Pirellulales bacterium]
MLRMSIFASAVDLAISSVPIWLDLSHIDSSQATQCLLGLLPGAAALATHIAHRLTEFPEDTTVELFETTTNEIFATRLADG